MVCHFWPGVGVDIFFVGDSWVVAVIQLKGGIAGTSIFRIIIDEFSYWQELYRVIPLIVDKGSEVVLYCTILPFSLAINLGLEGGREFLLNAKKIA